MPETQTEGVYISTNKEFMQTLRQLEGQARKFAGQVEESKATLKALSDERDRVMQEVQDLQAKKDGLRGAIDQAWKEFNDKKSVIETRFDQTGSKQDDRERALDTKQADLVEQERKTKEAIGQYAELKSHVASTVKSIKSDIDDALDRLLD